MNDAFDVLTDKDEDRAVRENRKNGWGFSYPQFKRLVYRHKNGDEHTRQYIEYRLTDANFHAECGLLMRGEYDKALDSFRGL